MSVPPSSYIPSPIGAQDAYQERIRGVPMLSFEAEQSLARQFHNDGDLEAARQLVVSHLRFVATVARGYSGYGLPQGDLIQEGNIGLMKAVKRFDPEVGVRLVSFAVHWIRAEMHEFIIRNWRIVKVATTKAQRKLFFNLRSQKKRLGWMNDSEVKAVARELNVDPSEVLLMEERLNAHDSSYDNAVDDYDEEFTPTKFLQDLRFEPAGLLESLETARNEHRQLQLALENLDDRSRDIIASRWLVEPKFTLKQLAVKYTVSAERIRQIEQNAFKVLRDHISGTLLLPEAQTK